MQWDLKIISSYILNMLTGSESSLVCKLVTCSYKNAIFPSIPQKKRYSFKIKNIKIYEEGHQHRTLQLSWIINNHLCKVVWFSATYPTASYHKQNFSNTIWWYDKYRTEPLKIQSSLSLETNKLKIPLQAPLVNKTFSTNVRSKFEDR